MPGEAGVLIIASVVEDELKRRRLFVAEKCCGELLLKRF